MKRNAYVSRSATLAGLALLVMAVSLRAEETGDATALLRKTGNAFAAVAKKAIPAVVFIQVEKTMGAGHGGRHFQYNDPYEYFGDDFLNRLFQGRPPAGQNQRRFVQKAQGSGFLISEDGYILTNSHVVGDADRITVRMHDGRELEARRIGADPKSEVAVIKVEGTGFPYVELGDSSKLEIGEWVLAVGNPFGLAETVTAGIVSAKGRSGMGIADYENFIQTDAAINPGNSGGPLLDIDAKVVGINTAIYSQTGGSLGIGFAIPIDMARGIKDQLVQSGKVARGYLGILIQDMSSDLAQSFGLPSTDGILIANVEEDSPADKGGLLQADVILKVGGENITGVAAFRNRVAANPPGTSLKLTLFREGKQKEQTVVTGTLPGETDVSAQTSEIAERVGLDVQDLTPEIARQLSYRDAGGVVVSAVERDSAAWRAGIQVGHLIASVNRERVSNVAEYHKAMTAAIATKTVLLRVQAGNVYRFVVLRLD